MIILSIIIFGLIIGSFLNAVIHRLHTGDSILVGRSSCPHCGHQLAPRDLIPLLSFLWLQGRCRFCGKGISWQYPVVEALTAIIFVLLYRQTGPHPELAVSMVFASGLIVIGVFDFKHYLILDKVLLPLGAIAIGWNLYSDLSSSVSAGHLVSGLLSGLGLAGFFGAQYLVSRGRWIGLGDVKLGFVLGNTLLWPLSLCMLMLAYFSGAIVGVGLIGLKKKQMSSQMPFGVFLAISAIITMLYGDGLVSWYRGLIGL